MKEKTEIEGAFMHHFKDILKSSNPSKKVIEKCLKPVEPHVTKEMNAKLQTEFTRAGVEEELHQMTHLKSPCPNGYGAFFIQFYWNIVGDEVYNAILSFLKGEEVWIIL